MKLGRQRIICAPALRSRKSHQPQPAALRPALRRDWLSCPSLVLTAALLADLAPLYRYDASIPTSGGAFPVPNNGCASARPWRIGNLWEIPLTLPRDGSLRFLGYDPEAIGALWRDAAITISRSGGIVSLLTHCESAFSGDPAMLGIYRGFLEWLASDPRFEFARADRLVSSLEKLEIVGDAHHQQRHD
jgi:hypothetical protein